MITITKEVSIQPGIGDSGPYTYVWNVTTPSTSCVSMSAPSGTITNPDTETISNTFTFFNTTCLDNTTVTLSITYNNSSCTKTITVPITNPCTDFRVNTISNSVPYTFTTSVTNGTGPFTYNWIFDTTLFTDSSPNPNSNTLVLTPVNTSNPPTDYIIGVEVTDHNGCKVYDQRQFISCFPTANNHNAQLQCTNSGSAGNVCITPDICPNTTIDWSTFTVTSHLSGFTITDLNDSCGSNGRLFRVEADNTVTGNTSYQIKYTVEDSNGQLSNEGTIYVSVPSCSANQSPITILNSPPFQIDCTYTSGSTYYIGPMDDYVVSTSNIDWTTLMFVDPATGSTTAGPYTTPGGATVTFNQTTLKFEYVIPLGVNSDFFQWTVCNIDGNCATSTIAALILVCPPTPTAVNDSFCGTCGQEEEHAIISNDTINGQLTDVSIITAPTHGIAVFNGNLTTPKILYTANSNYAGTDTYVYQITNDSGQSDTATVTVTVQCAGQDTNIAICE